MSVVREKVSVLRYFGVHVCGRSGRSGLTLAWQCLALQPPSLEPVSQPSSACQSLAQQRQCSTPASGAPNPPPEQPNDWKSYLKHGTRKAKEYLKLKTRQAHVFTSSCNFYLLNAAGTQEFVAICALFYIFSVFISTFFF